MQNSPTHSAAVLASVGFVAEPHPQQAQELAAAARIPLVLAELLVARGITRPDEAFAFLNPEFPNSTIPC